jgi:hypothetical protein
VALYTATTPNDDANWTPYRFAVFTILQDIEEISPSQHYHLERLQFTCQEYTVHSKF